MGYEVDFLAVGDESKSGDAIALRFGDLGNRAQQTVMVIDGGFKEDGERLVERIRTRYGTNIVDYVVSTHPDEDHVNGLHAVIDKMQVKCMLMHQPWAHSQNRDLLESVEAAKSLYDKAVAEGISVSEPFAGAYKQFSYGRLEILGPSKEYYKSLLPEFSVASRVGQSAPGMVRAFVDAARSLKELWGQDSLADDEETSATNNSSVILNIATHADGKIRRLLFTGDAGIPALSKAADALSVEMRLNPLRVIQIPHHGSKHNVGPAVLNQIVGDIVMKGTKRNITAVASCAKEGEPKHPNKRVLNAFTRRGVNCYKTQGSNFWVPSLDAPARPDSRTVAPCEFYDEVEEDA